MNNEQYIKWAIEIANQEYNGRTYILEQKIKELHPCYLPFEEDLIRRDRK